MSDTKKYQVRLGFVVAVERADGFEFRAKGGQIVELTENEFLVHQGRLEPKVMKPNWEVTSGTIVIANQRITKGEAFFYPEDKMDFVLSAEHARPARQQRFDLKLIEEEKPAAKK